jgi:hypothetical protein
MREAMTVCAAHCALQARTAICFSRARIHAAAEQDVMRFVLLLALAILSECPLLAQSGHLDTLNQCPLSGVKRTPAFGLFLLDAGGLDDLGPLLGFRGDEMAEISG